MKKYLFSLVSVFILTTLLVGCGNVEQSVEDSEKEGLAITTSFSILGDIVEQVIGERGSVDYIVPIGEEPHEYEPVPSDFRKVSDSDVFYVNGMDLEGWLERLIQNVGNVPVVTLSDGIQAIPLSGGDGEDPHAWMDVQNVIIYVNNLVEDLIERDPEGESVYRENAAAYIAELQELDEWIKVEVASIPENNRVIVLSENAYRYFGAAYALETVGIWELNSNEEGTPQQINRVVDIIRNQKLPAVFVETTVDQRYMQTVASNTGVEIAGEVYTDAVGLSGSGAETYVKMMEHNVRTIVEGLR